MTKTPPLTPEQITGIGVSVKKEGDKFVYTTPTKISFGNLDNIPVTVKG